MFADQINRRQAIFTAAAVMGAANQAPALAQTDLTRSDSPWIDAHVHVWTPDVAKYPLGDGYKKPDMQPPSFTPRELMAHASPCGVGRVVLIQMSFYRYDNGYMLDVMEQFPGVYSGVGVIDEDQRPADAMRALAKRGVRGFRIQPHDRSPETWLKGDGMQAMWKQGAESNLAMCCLINPEFLPSVAAMCQRHPQAPVVIDHFARIGIDGVIQDADVDQLCRLAAYPRVSVKVSAYYALGKKQEPYQDLGPMIRKLRDAFGAERLMWASDCPFQVQGDHSYQASFDLIRQGLSFLSEDDKAWILAKTASKVFF